MPATPAAEPYGGSMCGIVSLLTDFGVTEPFVGLVKAQILARHAMAKIVDLTHGVPPYSTEVAAFWIERSYRYFPAGSVHVAIVDPGVGTARRILLVALDDQLFLAPDNGLLGRLAGRDGARVRTIEMDSLPGLGIHEPSPTFHGRDVFGPLAADLSSGKVRFDQLGSACPDWIRPTWAGPEREDHTLRGQVIIIDSFGNCFSNIDSTALSLHEIESVTFGTARLPLVRTYGDRAPGTGIALINAFGVLEAACVEGNARQRLGLQLGSPVEAHLGVLRPTADASRKEPPDS
jgi:S-adenosylmethionine hydrolase